MLQQHYISKKYRLLINPGNLFWSIISKKDFNKDNSINKKILSLYNKFRDRLDVSMQDFRFKTDLNSVYINPTDLCNADCPYCYIPASRRKNGRAMSHTELFYVLGKIDRYFRRHRKNSKTKPMIIYHASEPLLERDAIFSSVVKFSQKFHFGIQTNAILLTKEDIRFLKSYKVSVGISLDSFEPEINDRTRRSSDGGNYSSAIRAIEWFRGYEGLSVITTVTKYNIKSLAGLVRLMYSKKVPCLLLNPVRATRRAIVKLRPPEKQLSRYFIEAVEEAMRLSKGSNREIIIGNFSNILLGILAPRARRLMCDISPCGGGRCFFTITASGDMIPCGEFIGVKEFYGGNIFDSSIEKAISSKPFKIVRSRIVERIKECSECIYRNICGSPCPAEVYSLSKDINKISPYCEFYKAIIQYAFKLIAEDKIKYLFRKKALRDLRFEYKLKIWDH